MRRWWRPRVLPGFGLSLGITVVMLSFMVLVPLAMLLVRISGMSAEAFFAAAFSPRALASYRVSLTTSAAAAVVATLVGSAVAWTLVRYPFPGRALVDAIVDLPFALPTAVAGVSLATLYGPHGPIGAPLERWLGIEVAYTPVGIVLALVFIGVPFVVRTVQPVLEDLDPELEEAATSLGATRSQVLRRVVIPSLLPAMLTGMALAFARGVGEYGSVIFIAGNMPMRTEIAPLLIVTRLEEFDYEGASALAVVMMVVALGLLLLLNSLQRWVRLRQGDR
jgi:sulfate transport system permease protein